MSSRVRQNFHQDSEAFINKQINMEMYASYVYLAMVRKYLKFGLLGIRQTQNWLNWSKIMRG